MDPAERGKVRHAGWKETTRVSSHGPMVEVTGQRHSAIEGHPLAIQNLLHANRRRGIYPHHGRPKFVVVDGVVVNDYCRTEEEKNRRFLI